VSARSIVRWVVVVLLGTFFCPMVLAQPNRPLPHPNQPNQPFRPNQPQQPKPPSPPQMPPGPITQDDANKAASAACGVMMIVMIVAGIASLTFCIVWIFVAMWAAKDAQARGMDNSTMWGFLVFFLGLLGLIIYLVSRPSEPAKKGGMKIVCRECGKKHSRGLKRCPACGAA